MKRKTLNLNKPLFIQKKNGRLQATHAGNPDANRSSDDLDINKHLRISAWAPPLPPERLGDPEFKHFHGVAYPYVIGAMAKGITSVDMVTTAAENGLLAFFGAAGLPPDEIRMAIATLQNRVGNKPFGFNLIHSPLEPDLETKIAQLYMDCGVRLVSASAYLNLTLPLVRYRVTGIHQTPDGSIVCPNRIVAKVSRVEVAQRFLSPPPERFLRQLVEAGDITSEQAVLTEKIPMADDITAEADSGGHTDNRPAITLLPTICALRDRLATQYGYRRRPCVGLGGGISTPHSAAAAFAMGAAYLLAGSIHQACVESGTSDAVRQMLAVTRQADVTMAPSADMFEMGGKVQVLRRGTMFPMRAAKLHELYTVYDRYEDIPMAQRVMLERDLFKNSFDAVWEKTQLFFEARDPSQVKRALDNPKHKMALVFRAYLGQSSSWANNGDADRVMDYQIWCGPAMGAFNEWVRGSFLEKPENRKSVTVALNLLVGAAVLTRVRWIMTQGVKLPAGSDRFDPLPPDKLTRYTQTEETSA